MLITRQCDTEHSHWPFSKYDPAPKPGSARMSNTYDASPPASSDWQGANTFATADGSGDVGRSFHVGKPSHEASQVSHIANPLGIHVERRPISTQEALQDRALQPERTGVVANSDSAGEVDRKLSVKIPEPVHQRPVFSAEAHDGAPGPSTSSAPIATTSIYGTGQDTAAVGQVKQGEKEEDDEELEDDDMLDGDSEHPQTAAERAAARRKMKRFRLTHQQTRFLMSEFAKQPHPDAAHRERLSREIPGLSPRQVQVWFQNRRAKIKRLNADDRDRMIKMRAVPDDFDNVQALHSPYGAVHGMVTPMLPPSDYHAQQPFAHNVLRPLVVDVRRTEAGEHVSPTSSAQSFGNIGFSPSGSVSNSELMSPVSPASNDRYTYGARYRAPLAGGPRPMGQYGHPSPLDVSLEAGQQSTRSLQPPHLRDSMARARSDSLQSPLRSSMSWKGSAIDYSAFPGVNSSPTFGDRNPSMYQPNHVGPTPSSMAQYPSSSYHLSHKNELH